MGERREGRGARQTAGHAGQDRGLAGAHAGRRAGRPEMHPARGKRQVRVERTDGSPLRARRTRRRATRQEEDSGSESKRSAQHGNTNREAASEAEQPSSAGEEGGSGPPRAAKAMSVSSDPTPVQAPGLWFSAPACVRAPRSPPAPPFHLACAAGRRPHQAGPPARCWQKQGQRLTPGTMASVLPGALPTNQNTALVCKTDF